MVGFKKKGKIDPVVEDLILKMLEMKYEERISAKEAQKHPYFQNMVSKQYN